ncbi:MAG TPA: PLP-dependent transferase [Geminicoccaceae bacterium]|nr:PLP-dependent transferase [Geminicoccaceae bacterium]
MMDDDNDAPPLAEITRLIHDDGLELGGPVVPPVVQTSLFTFESYAALAATFAGERRQPVYTRVDNPTVRAFEDKVAMLEGAPAARAFASGMGAISAAVLALVQAGDRVVCVRHVYPDAYRLFVKLLPRLGVEVEFVDGADTGAVAKALPGARLLYLESPTSLVFETQDLPALAVLAREHRVATIADNSWATPVFQKPLAQGVDLVVHSASKYLSGHSDTVAGIVAGRRELVDRINDLTFPYLGAKLAPFDAFLLLRGLRTLHLRMRRHQESGLEVARWLAAHPLVTGVHHPGLREARSGLAGYASLFSLKFDAAVDIPRFCDGLRLFRLGVSWGGHESLAFPAMAGLQQTGGANAPAAFGVSPRLVRLHIGLEEPADLIADLDRAIRLATHDRQGENG